MKERSTPEPRLAIDRVLPGVRPGWPYDDSDRHYHDGEHIFEMVRFIADHGEDAGVNLDDALAAAVFHDWHYDPRAPKGANESLSAETAKHRLADVGWDSGRIGGIVRAIVATAGHEPSDDDLTQLVIEADLERFCSADLPRYDALVRAEYSYVPDDMWRAGRKAVLEHYRGICSQFRIGADSSARSQAAVANINRAIAALIDEPG